jgi:isopentenyldiphosphate isomerase
MINVATLWLVNEYGEILLAQRSYKKENEPGAWGPSMTGRLDPGETFDQALVREANEELGLGPDVITPHFLVAHVYDHPDGEQRTFGAYYALLPKAKTSLLKLQESEVEGVAWHTLVDIENWMQTKPEELVPSADAVWPATFEALKRAGVIELIDTLRSKAQPQT